MMATRAAQNTSDISIVAATQDDLSAVVAIEAEVFSDPWTRKAFAGALDLDIGFFACARSRAGAMLGYVVAWFAAGEGEIANLAVAPAQHGKGIGGRLLDAALERARSAQTSVVYLEVRQSNAAARRLYESREFVEVGRRRSYYTKPVEDAIVLRATLQQKA